MSQAGTAYIYNNTCVGSSYGITVSTGTVYAKNNICYDNDDGATNGTFHEDSDYNATDAASIGTGGAHDQTEQTFTFTGGDDYHLQSGDAGAKDLGVDLSGDGGLAFSNDIDDESRSGTWDIGADEYVAAGGGVAPTGVLSGSLVGSLGGSI